MKIKSTDRRHVPLVGRPNGGKKLNIFHKKELTERGIKFELVKGNWLQRFEKSVSIINKLCV